MWSTYSTVYLTLFLICGCINSVRCGINHLNVLSEDCNRGFCSQFGLQQYKQPHRHFKPDEIRYHLYFCRIVLTNWFQDCNDIANTQNVHGSNYQYPQRDMVFSFFASRDNHSTHFFI